MTSDKVGHQVTQSEEKKTHIFWTHFNYIPRHTSSQDTYNSNRDETIYKPYMSQNLVYTKEFMFSEF